MREPILADRLAVLEESATLALNARVKQMAAEGKTVYNLTAGELGWDTPDYIQTAVANTLSQNKYTPVAGLPELRQKIAEKSREFYKADWIQPSNVVVTAGAKPALYASLLTVINPGDQVILPAPFWSSHKHMAELCGGKVVTTSLTDNFDLDVNAIAEAITPNTKAIIINSPHNPTGAVFSADSLRKLAEILKGSPITVIADDPYTKLVFTDDFKPITGFGFDSLVIINGFSKSQALTGWRIGYLLAEDSLAQAAIKLLSHIMGNAAVPSQYAGLSALERGDKPFNFDTLTRQCDLVISALSEIDSLKFHAPEGAFYTFLDLQKVTDNSLEWCEQLLSATGVALVPGEAFSAPGFARLSFGGDEEVLSKALSLLKDYLNDSTTQKDFQ